MNKEELDKKLQEIDEKLTALGDLTLLIEQGKSLPQIISDLNIQQSNIKSYLDKIPEQSNNIINLTSNIEKLISELNSKKEEVSESLKKLGESNSKIEELAQKTTEQLGIAANVKLSHTFENIKEELIKDRNNWFIWLRISVLSLIITTGILVFWQWVEYKTIFEPTFLIKLALTSPFVYFTIFINREYNRTRNLIEEYTFKAAISKSFDAYHEIIKNSESTNVEKKLEFVTKAIENIYSSPMVNIKRNLIKEKDNSPSILNQTKSQLLDEEKN